MSAWWIVLGALSAVALVVCAVARCYEVARQRILVDLLEYPRSSSAELRSRTGRRWSFAGALQSLVYRGDVLVMWEHAPNVPHAAGSLACVSNGCRRLMLLSPSGQDAAMALKYAGELA